MTAYKTLIKDANAMLAQAEKLRRAERASVAAELRLKAAEYGLTAADVFGRGVRVARYRGPNGELWSGGRGRKPQWVRDLMLRGQDVEQYRINT